MKREFKLKQSRLIRQIKSLVDVNDMEPKNVNLDLFQSLKKSISKKKIPFKTYEENRDLRCKSTNPHHLCNLLTRDQNIKLSKFQAALFLAAKQNDTLFFQK